MTVVSGRDADELLVALGIELERLRAARVELCVIGGAALGMLGLFDRPTRDIDVVALAGSVSDGIWVMKAAPLPEALLAATSAVAHQFGIEPDWLNTGPADLIDHGLPPGFESRLITREYGPGLRVHFAGRLDQICFKTFAAADTAGRHLTDLVALGPGMDEMEFAFSWVIGQDPSPAFRGQLAELADYLEVRDALDRVQG